MLTTKRDPFRTYSTSCILSQNVSRVLTAKHYIVETLFCLYVYSMYFNNKFYVFASQMEPLHSLCKSYVFK